MASSTNGGDHINNNHSGWMQDAHQEDIPTTSRGATMPAPATMSTAVATGTSLAVSLPPSHQEHLPQEKNNAVKRTCEPNLDEEGSRHRPPMSVIVVSSPAAASDMQLGPPSGLSSRREARVTSSSVFSTPFRLQPRSTLAVGVTGQDGAIRGRKRSAQSMSTPKLGQPSLLNTSAKQLPTKPPTCEVAGKPTGTSLTTTNAPPKLQSMCASTPPRDTRRGLGRVDINFQCLSLQSPKRMDPSTPPPKLFPSPPHTSGLPPSSSSSSSGTATQRPAMVPGSIASFQSPAARSSSGQNRSSFTPVYNAGSPGGSYGSGSIGSNARMNVTTTARAAAQSPSLQSNCGGSTKSSPKYAPLTVLQDRGSKVPNRDNASRLPPLPGGGMNSLWLSLESQSSQSGGGGGEDTKSPKDDEAKMWPPRTVHCRKPSSDSISTVHNSVLSPLPRPSPMRSPGAFLSPASAFDGKAAATPRSKQRRVDDSPGHPTPRTPLPRVTLTPRSTGSRRSRRSGQQQGLPRFPSPSDVEMDVTSPFLNSAAAATLRDVSRMDGSSDLPRPPRRQLGTISSYGPASSNSLALSADGSTTNECKDSFASTASKKASLPVLDLSPHKRGEAKGIGGSSSPVQRDLSSGGNFMGIQTMSLLNSTHTGGILQAMMEESTRGGGVGAEMGSVSDIDEDEGFVLAPPSAIEEERFESCQPARQRRRKSCDRFANQAVAAGRGSPSLSPSASNTHLSGMNYVTSNTSLFGMDIAHPNDHATSAPNVDGLKKTSKSESLALACPQETHTFKRRKSDASSTSIGLALETPGVDAGRDLVTPPPMPNPQTPPPLSPKEGFFLPVVKPEGTVQHNFARRQTASVCIAGADRKSVTMAIARMASEAQSHAESSPVLQSH